MEPENLFKELRTRSGLSQARLSLKAGYDHSYVSRIESGSRRPTPEALEAFIVAMGIEGEDEAYKLMHSYGYVTDRHILGDPFLVRLSNRYSEDSNFKEAVVSAFGGI